MDFREADRSRRAEDRHTDHQAEGHRSHREALPEDRSRRAAARQADHRRNRQEDRRNHQELC